MAGRSAPEPDFLLIQHLSRGCENAIDVQAHYGTDIPIVMLHWTYRQSLDYIRSYCDFIPDEDMELILGGNMARLLGLAEVATG